MIVLGIESSCDETAVAIVRNGHEVLSSIVASQIDVHKVFGGVVPEVAAREHLKAIQPLFTQVMAESQLSPEEIDLIGVTQGPGLIGALLVGVSFAKGLATYLSKPLMPVDHVHAHVHGALLGLDQDLDKDQIFPCLSLVASGGHTNLYYMEAPTKFELLASTLDDACGECFDKVAKILGLPYPGGPRIESLARNGNPSSIPMPTMVSEKQKMMFSYSGLKTHVINFIDKHGPLSDSMRADLCASFQEEALGQLLRKIRRAIQIKNNVKALLVAGGVAANKRFRELVNSELKIESFFPKLTYCADNAAMIAALAWHEYNIYGDDHELLMNHDWDAYSRYRFEKVIPQAHSK